MNKFTSCIVGMVTSKKLKRISIVVGILAISLLAFGAGQEVGFRKAKFSFQWGENYHRNFGGPERGFMSGMFWGMREYKDGHGTFGKVISLNDNFTMTILSERDGEKSVGYTPHTEFRRQGERASVAEIHIDDYVVVIGSPTERGTINAKFIRILPPPLPAPLSAEVVATSTTIAPL